MLPVHGGGLQQQPTVTSAPRGTYQTRHPLWSVWADVSTLTEWSTQLTTLFLNAFYTISTTFYIRNATRHYLRHRRHNRVLPPKTGTLQINNFLVRQLYKDAY